jgi:hypothetical protein
MIAFKGATKDVLCESAAKATVREKHSKLGSLPAVNDDTRIELHIVREYSSTSCNLHDGGELLDTLMTAYPNVMAKARAYDNEKPGLPIS